MAKPDTRDNVAEADDVIGTCVGVSTKGEFTIKHVSLDALEPS